MSENMENALHKNAKEKITIHNLMTQVISAVVPSSSSPYIVGISIQRVPETYTHVLRKERALKIVVICTDNKR